jgi:hypothetical protein
LNQGPHNAKGRFRHEANIRPALVNVRYRGEPKLTLLGGDKNLETTRLQFLTLSLWFSKIKLALDRFYTGLGAELIGIAAWGSRHSDCPD